MGGRLLRTFLALPLLNTETITKRHNAVEALLEEPDLMDALSDALKGYAGHRAPL